MVTNYKTAMVGATVNGVFGLVLFLKVLDSEPIALWLDLGGNNGVRISCAPDGESIAVNSHFPWPCDMQTDGALVLVDKSNEVPWNVFKGAMIAAGMDVISDNSKTVIGIGLRTNTGHSVYVLNLGDKLYVFNSIDEQLIQAEALSLEQW